MTIFALTSLMSFVFATFLAAFLFFRDTRNILNRLFLLITLSVAYTSLMEFGYRQSSSYEDAAIWWRFDVLWSVHVSAWLHLCLAFTRPGKWLRNRWLLLAIYIPSALFIGADIFFHAVTGPPVHELWGWSYSIQHSLFGTISILWITLICVMTAVLYGFSFRTTSDSRKKEQSRYMFIAGIIPLFAVSIEMILIQLKTPFPPLGVPSFILANTCIAYAIWKYELFKLTPSRAAESILATMGDSLLLVGMESTIITANHATVEMLGYPEHELMGKSVLDLFAPDALIPDWVRELAPEKADTFRSKDIETEYITADGNIIPISLSGSMLYDENRDLRGFLLIARDITAQKKASAEITRHREKLEELVEQRTHELQQEIAERQKAETEKRKLEAQLYQSQKMEAIGRLAGGVAHDFNNLLFVINGYAETVLSTPEAPEDIKEDVSHILEAGSRASNLIRQLLAFSRRQMIDPVRIDVNERIKSSCTMLSRMIGEDIQINISSSRTESHVIMDITQLDQIIANLLVNSRDAMPKGGSIHIETDIVHITDTEPHDTAVSRPGEYVVISVTDTGIGIPRENLPKIFEPFFTSKSVGKGTGLGLATVYGIVKQNDGFIDVRSKVGQGTTFRIFIPRADVVHPGDVGTETGQHPIPGNETILLVEDEAQVRQLVKKQLESAGYRVYPAVSAIDALRLYDLHKSEIDIILSDVVMPGMSGVEMVEKITAESDHPKIIFMSGHNDELIDSHGIRKTPYPFLPKPFTANQLCRRIRNELDGRTSHVSLPFIAM